MRRRRIWTELLPPRELASAPVRALLQRHGLAPLIALPPSRETPEMADALRALHTDGIPIGLWPLLPDELGYWASAVNATEFAARVEECLAFAAVPVETVAIDLEPPLSRTHALLDPRRRARAIAEASAEAFGPGFDAARPVFSALATSLADRGIETLAAVFPMLVLDLASGRPLFQRWLGTPVDAFAIVSPMLYTTVIGEVVGSQALARRMLFGGARGLRAAIGGRASVSLGLVGPGKLGDEPYYADLSAFGADLEAARAAGVEDLALYSLEAVLARRDPEAWLRRFAHA